MIRIIMEFKDRNESIDFDLLTRTWQDRITDVTPSDEKYVFKSELISDKYQCGE
jgi:hypothetical protein